MPINKNAFIRYQALDRCFRNPGRSYSIDDLVDECNKVLEESDPSTSGVKKRQVYKDINYMESGQGWSVPLERFKVGYKTYFRYSDLKFSINNQPLNQMEAEQLRSALMILSKFKGMPQFKWVNELLPKLKQSFSLTENDNEIMGFDDNIYLKGIEYISDLFNSIMNKQVIELTYQSFKANESISVILHPYYLKQYNNRWFLFGLSDEYKNISVYALDRIKSIKKINTKYKLNKSINFEEYFEDIIGVTLPNEKKAEKILLKLTKEYAPYVVTKPLHGSQKEKKRCEDGSLIVSIEVIPNHELMNLLLSMGTGVEVLKPESLRKEMGVIVKDLNIRYEQSANMERCD